MAFCTFSSEKIINNYTQIENSFLKEFLPVAPDYAIKVYLYGLYNCNNPTNEDNTLQSFARILNMEEDEIVEAFFIGSR